MAKYGTDTLEPRINRALAEFNLHGVYGNNWSVAEAKRQLIRIGTNPITDTTRRLVWDVPTVEEVLLKTTDGNLIDTLSGSSALDTTHVFDIYGSYFDAEGNLMRIVQRVNLDGQNQITLPVPLARVCEVIEIDYDLLVGDVYVYQDTAVTGGVPNDLTKVAAYVNGSGGRARSLKAACVTAGDEALVVLGGLMSVNKKQSVFSTFTLQSRPVDSDTWVTAIGSVTLNSVGTSAIQVDPLVLGVLPPNHDVRVICDSSASATPVEVTLMGQYAKQSSG